MKSCIAIVLLFLTVSCSSKHAFILNQNIQSNNRLTGGSFYKQVLAYKWQQRDSLATAEILSGNYPDFFKQFVPVTSTITDSLGKVFTAIFYVAPDYLCIGTNEDWVRVPLTPMAAQKIADSLNCFLPTRKIVNLIYEQATVKLEPQPMFVFRDSSISMWQHHLMIEGLRKNKKGLIAGIKKDIVLTNKLLTAPNKVAIYGWHQLNGKPIQPLYTGHINWYVDYSHGARLIYRKIKINGTLLDYQQVLNDPFLKQLICDENDCSFTKYSY